MCSLDAAILYIGFNTPPATVIGAIKILLSHENFMKVQLRNESGWIVKEQLLTKEIPSPRAKTVQTWFNAFISVMIIQLIPAEVYLFFQQLNGNFSYGESY